MRRLLLKFNLALALGLSLTLGLLGLLIYFNVRTSPARAAGPTVCLAGPPTCTFTNIQAAVDAAAAGEVIKVAAGTYPGVSLRAGMTQTVYISKSITIRGGYTTTFSEPPDPEANPTILDAQGQGRVLVITGEVNPIIEGLRITGGHTSSSDAFIGRGGGILVISATAVLSHNWIFSNTAESDGGGLALMNSRTTLKGNEITFNKATLLSSLVTGGGLFVVGEAIIEANVISANIANDGGGGVLLAGGSGLLPDTGAATFSSNIVSGNQACYGGGVDLVFSTAALSGNIISGNAAITSPNCMDGLGGGVLIDQESTAMLINNLVVDNQVAVAGSGLYISDSSPRLLHTTIARNLGGDGSGLYIADRFSPFNTVSLTNTILVSHTVGITVAAGSTATLESTLWQGNLTDWDGAGTINVFNNYTGDPAFVDPNNGDYHLSLASAALDKGINAGVLIDLDGEPRPQGQGYDLGADESAAPTGRQIVFLPLILK